MNQKLPPDEYYAQLAKVPTSSGAIVRNERGEFLVLSHTYKTNWHIAGGMRNKGETPRQAMFREVKEEIGITINEARIFCIDFNTDAPFDRINFVYDCGTISDEQISGIMLEKDEISEYRFVNEEEFFRLLSPKIAKRMHSAISAFHSKGCVYLENGENPA